MKRAYRQGATPPALPRPGWLGEAMAFKLPDVLADQVTCVGYLRGYYGLDGGRVFEGARFDTWDSTGTRAADANRFTADDMVAVSFLSVNVPPLAAEQLIITAADRFSDLLTDLGEDRDLVADHGPADSTWAGWKLLRAIDDLDDVGPTIATKLLARKRPRLRPVYDSVVAAAVGSDLLWAPLQQALAENGGALHDKLLGLRAAAGLPDELSALRIFDVIVWRDGKKRGLGGRAPRGRR